MGRTHRIRTEGCRSQSIDQAQIVEFPFPEKLPLGTEFKNLLRPPRTWPGRDIEFPAMNREPGPIAPVQVLRFELVKKIAFEVKDADSRRVVGTGSRCDGHFISGTESKISHRNLTREIQLLKSIPFRQPMPSGVEYSHLGRGSPIGTGKSSDDRVPVLVVTGRHLDPASIKVVAVAWISDLELVGPIVFEKEKQ